jgi:CheY-like chemotaxis protein
MENRPNVLVVDNELFFSVRIETTLRKLGYAVEVTGNAAQALERAKEQPLALAIVNFASQRLSAPEIIRQLKALPDSPPVLCFMPHKQMPELRPPAREAGADLIVANSALSMRLPQLVEKLIPLDGSRGSLTEAAQLAEEEEETE